MAIIIAYGLLGGAFILLKNKTTLFDKKSNSSISSEDTSLDSGSSNSSIESGSTSQPSEVVDYEELYNQAINEKEALESDYNELLSDWDFLINEHYKLQDELDNSPKLEFVEESYTAQLDSSDFDRAYVIKSGTSTLTAADYKNMYYSLNNKTFIPDIDSVTLTKSNSYNLSCEYGDKTISFDENLDCNNFQGVIFDISAEEVEGITSDVTIDVRFDIDISTNAITINIYTISW